jgi:hypothetical protein
MDMIDFIMKIDMASIRQQKQANVELAALGLHFARPPSDVFKKIAHQPNAIYICRLLNTIHFQRVFYFSMAIAYVDLVIASPMVGQNQSVKTEWINFRKTLQKLTRMEADLLLSSLPFYITPGSGPLNPANVLPLVWPLLILTSPQLTLAQQLAAKDALHQIGDRASVPTATKLASAEFGSHAEISKEAHMLHQC